MRAQNDSGPAGAALRAAAIVLAAALGLSRSDDPAVLRVDGEPIPSSVYEDWLVHERGEALAEAFARRWLALREAQRAGIVVDPDAVCARVDAELGRRIAGAFGGDRETWAAELAAAGRSEAGRRAERTREVEVELAADLLVRARRTVGEEEVTRAWEAAYGPGGRRPRLSVLRQSFTVDTLPGEDAATRERRAARLRERRRAELAALRERIIEGADFGEVARRHSDHASASRGGRADDLDLARWPAQARAAVEALGLGEVSPPVFATGAFWLVRVDGIARTPRDEVAGALRDELARRPASPAEIDDLVGGLLRASSVRVLDAMFAGGTGPTDGDEPLLAVDGEPVARATFARWLRRYRGEVDARRFAEAHRIERAAREAGIAPTAAEVEARVSEETARLIELFHRGDRAAWLARLASEGRTEGEYLRQARSLWRTNLRCEGLLRQRRRIDEAALRRAWEERYGRDGRRVELRWIRVDAELPPRRDGEGEAAWRAHLAEAMDAARAEALDLRQRVLEGQDFATLAEHFSDDPATRSRGGSPGPDFRLDRLPSDVARALAPLAPGDVSEPLPNDASYLVFEVLAVHQVPLEEARDELATALREARATPSELAAFKREVLQAASVEVLPAMMH